MKNIAKTAIIYPYVRLGENVIVEDYCIIGCSSDHKNSGKETVIGENSHIRSHTTIYEGNIIGKNFRTGNKVNIREDNRVGDDVSIGTLSNIEHHVTIQDGVRIHSQVFIPEYSLLMEGAWLGPNVVLTNAKYPNTPVTKKYLKGPIIGPSAIVGANSTLLPGVELGANCLVGAGSVVTKNVPPSVVVYGNPAVYKKNIDDLGYPENNDI